MEKINLVGFPCFFPKWLRTISVKPSEENFSRKHSPKGIGQNWPQNFLEWLIFNRLRIISETQWKKSEEKSAICGRLKVNSFLKNLPNTKGAWGSSKIDKKRLSDPQHTSLINLMLKNWRNEEKPCLTCLKPISPHSTSEIPTGFRVTEFITIVHSTKMVKGERKNP